MEDQNTTTVPGSMPTATNAAPLSGKMELKSERKVSRLLMLLVFVVIVVIAIGGFLFFTDPGKNLLGLNQTTTSETPSDTTNNLPNENQNELSDDYSDSSEAETVDSILEEIDEALTGIDETTDFEDPDEELELGL